MIKIINTCCRYLVALVFLFSGFVKLVDPYGTAYKISDYLEVLHIMLPFGLYLTASTLLSVVEFTLGINLLFKAHYQSTLKLLLGLVGVFTLLTLYIAIVNPVQDCGCFGDALVISNWQTFIKNLVLLVFALEMWRNRNYLRTRVVEQSQIIMLVVAIIFSLSLALSSIRHLPFIDFRPYQVGSSIIEGMQVPPGEPQDVYETTYYYENDGNTETFTEDNYPWQDTTWHYVDSESVLVKEGAEPAIHDFVLNHTEFGDITDDVLNDPNYSFFLVAPHLDQISLKHLDEIRHIAAFCHANACRFLVLTASIGAETEEFRAYFDAPIELCNVDEIQLKTMVRSKPGLMLIKEGVILEKYHHNDLPHFDEGQNPLSLVLSHKEKRESRIIVLFLALLLGVLYYKLLQKKDYSK